MTTSFSLSKGRTERDVGMSRAVDSDQGNVEFLHLMRDFAIHYSLATGGVTADDVRAYADVMGMHPSSPKVWGSVFSGRGWRCIGHHQSALVSNHAHEYKVWQWEGAE